MQTKGGKFSDGKRGRGGGLGHIFVINYHNLTKKKFVKYFDYNWLSEPKKWLNFFAKLGWKKGRKENKAKNGGQIRIKK